MKSKERYAAIERGRECPAEDAFRAFDFFVKEFVVKPKRDRWRGVFGNPKKALKNSHKLPGDLDRQRSSSVLYESVNERNAVVIFYDYFDPPLNMLFSDAVVAAYWHDALIINLKERFAYVSTHDGDFIKMK